MEELWEELWGRSHGGGIMETFWRRSRGEDIIELKIQRRTKQEESRRRHILEAETSKRNPGGGFPDRESSKSNPGGGIRKRTWSKSLGRGIIV